MNGLDRFIQEFHTLKATPAAILTNHATLSQSGYPAAYELLRNGYSLKKIFSPEHGATSQGADGAEQHSGTDALTQLPLISLYGNRLVPDEKDLRDIELILMDLPNIGCRFYTYWWTITYMIESCARANKKLILLDRPNLSRRQPYSSEGPLLDEETCHSFLGRWSMPLTYSYSYGQLAKWFVHEKNISVNLQVINFDPTDSDPPFIPPSPSINEWQATLIYPATGLFEGLNINTGRGTAFPFRVLGAPWLDSIKLFEDFSQQNIPGLKALPNSYRPEWSRYSGMLCNGLYFHVTDPDHFKPVHTGIWFMNYLAIHYPGRLEEATYPTAANPSGKNHLDRLLGIKDAYAVVCAGKQISHDEIDQWLDVSDWTEKVNTFLTSR